MKKGLLFFSFSCFIKYSFSQCAMCKAVVESGNSSVAEGINNGITYLMIFPYILVGLLAYLLVRHRRKLKNS